MVVRGWQHAVIDDMILAFSPMYSSVADSLGSPQYELKTCSGLITQYSKYNKPIHLSKSHTLLDLRNCLRGVQSLRTRPAAVQDGVASVQAHAVVEGFLSLGGAFVAGVVEPSV